MNWVGYDNEVELVFDMISSQVLYNINPYRSR